jgi:hypothetical protein
MVLRLLSIHALFLPVFVLALVDWQWTSNDVVDSAVTAAAFGYIAAFAVVVMTGQCKNWSGCTTHDGRAGQAACAGSDVVGKPRLAGPLFRE